VTVSGWQGLALGPQGFLTLSAEYLNRNATSRGDFDPRKSPIQVRSRFGDPEVEQYTIYANAGYGLGDSGWELYGFGGYQHRDSTSAATPRIVGGIGGNNNRAMAEPLSDDPRLGFYNFGIAVPIGGAGGAGGDGGAVTVTNTGSVLTEGEGAVGIFAQSVGGGGGVRGRVGIQTPVTPDIFDSLANWIGSMGGAGDAGAVRVTTGEVVTRGAYADAVFAQSTGGTGVGGDVRVSVDGDVMAFGEGAHGVRVQSAGLAGDGDILVEVARGARVFGGAGTMATAVWFMDGEAADGRNSLRNDGVIASAQGVAGYAVRGSTAQDSVLNRGLISGNIDLGDGVNRLINEVDGVLWSGLVLRLGAGNTLHNAGVVSIRGDDVGATVITGDYAQSADGRLLFQHDALTGLGDTLRVVGTAALQGTVVADVANLDQLATGRHATDLISADQMNLSNVSLIAPQSLVVQFSLEDVQHSQGDTLRLLYDIDYSPDLPGLSGNRAALGDYIGRIQDAGGTPAFRPIANLILQVVDPEQLKALYDNLSPQLNTASTSADFGSHARFSDSLFSCSPMSGAARVEAADGRCVWARGGRRDVEREADASASGYDSAIDTFALGVESPVGAGLRAGVALGAEREKVTLADHTGTGDIRRSQLGAVIKAPGRLADLAVFATVGWSETDLRRGVAIPTPSLARSEQAATAWGVGVRATGNWGDESGWIRPTAQVDGMAVDREAYVEQGGGPGALSVEGEREDYWRVRVGVETGAGLPFGDGMILRPTARIGVSHRLDTPQSAVRAGFVSAPMGTGLFETRIQEDETVLETGLGLEISNGRGGAVRFDYARRDGDVTREQSFTAKLVVPF
ncbi:MAG: autotransporter domain-containing protein, partial [Alphaproteobacteria bacterium]|nr:autotransporter domain-containing protein [Alphaproteobacteria bacterium]